MSVDRMPKLCRHKATGRFYCTLSGREVYLGTDRRKARAEYARVVGEWLANGRHHAPVAVDLTVAELLDRYRVHAEKYYRLPTGEPTSELGWIASSMRPLRRLYGSTLGREFGPLALEVVRAEFIRAGLTRKAINSRVDRIRRFFRWCVSRELLPPAVVQALEALPGLRHGRTEARESAPVRPVDDALIDRTLPYMPAVVADMVRLQRLTGARPGEVCQLRPCDLDRTADVWTYRPLRHKTAHHGRERIILVGPRGQEILRPYLLRPAGEFCFSAAESETQRRAEAHARRVTPLHYGNRPGTNRARTPARPAGDRYTRDSYRRAIHRACDAANRAAVAEAAGRGERLDAGARLVPRWSPNRLRHAAATELRSKFGIEAAQLVLGHADPKTSLIYAEADLAKAAAFVRQTG